MSRRKNSADELRAQMTEALLRDVGISERMSAPIIDSVMRCFAGQKAYFPAAERDYPVQQIRASLEAGKSVKRVCSDFELSRRTLYRLFPDGLPAVQGGRSVA